MYRPTKKKVIRRLSAASIVAVLAAAGFAVTIVSQSPPTNSALRSSNDKDASASTRVTASSPHYHLNGANRNFSVVDE